ncbi:beta-hydroxyacyl-ACP dehydratase [bacterium]|nr:beta-hydroxyacyl-ACP dehydratase [bacterium]
MLSNDPKKTIPHREPFIWVSRLMSRAEDGGEGVVEFDVTEDLDVFRGHFPGNPIFPGVLQLEGSAQACMWVLFGEEDPDRHEGYFASVDSFKFKKMVKPGDRLSISCKRVALRASLHKWEVAVVDQDQRLCSKGVVWLKLADGNHA